MPRTRPFDSALSQGNVQIVGAREHNLKNVSLDIPRGRFVVVTGVSGSGKSTLAFDLLFAEGQRRFLDCLNAYARQFIEQLARPDVDRISGIPPTVSIEQRNSRGGGKSTVATVTEIHHFLRLLFARLGTLCCPDCRTPVRNQTRDQVAAQLRSLADRSGPVLLLVPLARHRKGFHNDLADWADKHGYARVRADGALRPSNAPLQLDRFKEHDVEVVIGELHARQRIEGARPGVSGAAALIDDALEVGKGTLLALDASGQVTPLSTRNACPRCSRSFQPLDPKHFSYNSAQGWCPRCRGFGELFYLPEVERGARADAIEESWFEWQEGKREPCPECGGMRLNPVARAVRLELPGATGRKGDPTGATLDDIARMAVGEATAFFGGIRPTGDAARIARDILPEIRERLRFLDKVGLGYLQLGRAVPSLSGGEAQRIRLAAQLGSNLSGVLYILDEPTIGLHARDNDFLLAALRALRARGNSLLVVEHDEATMRAADHIIDLGPGAGARGGQVVATGTLAELRRHPDSITGHALRQRPSFPHRGARRPTQRPRPKAPSTPPWLTLHNATRNNLDRLTVRFPLERLVVITGVSGSGKSTLVRECLLPALHAMLARKRSTKTPPAALATGTVSDWESLRAVYEVDQSPIGRTPRSTPSTYVGFFDDIRALFAQAPEARLRGYGPGRFSFNSPQGRCAACEGTGNIKLEMNFLPAAYVRCETCNGTRFSQETLDIEWRGLTVAQVLDLTVAEALEHFDAHPRIRRALQALADTGLDYLHLGQISPTLSGGEAQRIKLVAHLLAGLPHPPNRRATARSPLPERPRPAVPTAPASPIPVPRTQRPCLFVLEEPTIGLHAADVRRLVGVLQRLVDAGHSVIVIEHHLDLIAEADWVIDLGPEAGAGGGRVCAQGPPEIIAATPGSHTGRYLQPLLRRTRASRRPRPAVPNAA